VHAGWGAAVPITTALAAILVAGRRRGATAGGRDVA
jgi:hypothetical protein